MPSLVCLRTFPTREAAIVAGNALREHGIESAVSAHDGGDGGYDFSFASIGAELLVGEETAETAREILASLEQAAADDDTIEDDQTAESDAKRSMVWIGATICFLVLLAKMLGG